MRRIIIGAVAVLTLAPFAALAHCPLCTIGAGAAATGALWLGVSPMSIGVFLGAFSVALGLWVARMVKREFIPKQKHVIAVISIVGTIWPLKPMLKDISSVYISWAGDYGSLLNRTYVFDRYIIGAAIGILIMLASPYASRWISRVRGGKILPYQGIALTFVLLLAVAAIIEFVV